MSISALFACFMSFVADFSYPLVIFIVMLYALFVQGYSVALNKGVIKMAHNAHVGMTIALQFYYALPVYF